MAYEDYRLPQKTAKEKRASVTEGSDILERLKYQYKLFQVTYCENTSLAKLIKDAIDELERLYADQS